MATQRNSKTTDGWKKAGQHEVTLPSGFQVTITVPNLPNLVKTGYFPNNLVQEALKTLADPDQEVTQEVIGQQAEFYSKLVAISVVEPKVTEDEVNDLPFEDVEMIVAIATRQRDLDAVGHHIGGLHTQEDWRRFRGLTAEPTDVAGIQGS
jgi:hypothetical protein